jgi:hypothetical protein
MPFIEVTWDQVPEDVKQSWREGVHRPARGSDVEAWLKTKRNAVDRVNPDPTGISRAVWHIYDSLLEEYRLRADTGLYLHEDISKASQHVEQ